MEPCATGCSYRSRSSTTTTGRPQSSLRSPCTGIRGYCAWHGLCTRIPITDPSFRGTRFPFLRSCSDSRFGDWACCACPRFHYGDRFCVYGDCPISGLSGRQQAVRRFDGCGPSVLFQRSCRRQLPKAAHVCTLDRRRSIHGGHHTATHRGYRNKMGTGTAKKSKKKYRKQMRNQERDWKQNRRDYYEDL